jgi:hypothetical protein
MWVKVEEFDNYFVNESGEVLNVKNNHIKHPFLNKNGYYYVSLYKNNTGINIPLHRIIANAFIPNPYGKKTVDHIDGNRTNNSINNLRWATYSEQNSRFSTVGIRSERIRVSCVDGEVIEFEQIQKAAEYFGCTISNISQMLKKGTYGKRGKTRFYKFEYVKV